MKNIIGIFVIIIAAAMAFISCDPVENRFDMGGAITVDQLDVTVTALVVDGVRSNKLILENRSPILSSWNYGMGISTSAHDTVLVSATGDLIVTFTGLNANGSIITKDIPVTVDAIIFQVVGMDLLIGDGSKTWVWDEFTNERDFGGTAIFPYGIGGVWPDDTSANGDKSPAWWGLTFGNPDFFEDDATMTFALNDDGAVFVKTLANGTEKKGSFSFNLSKGFMDWSKGILSLKGATIPHPVSMNNPAGDAYEFYILALEEDQLVLATGTGNTIVKNPQGEVNIWMFRPKGWEPATNEEQMAAITGGDKKIWTWDEKADAVWGIGPFLSSGPVWWAPPLGTGDFESQVEGEGKGATMTFSMAGTLDKTLQDGSVKSGTFGINMNKPTLDPDGDIWAMGKLNTSDVTILFGRNPNGPGKPNVYSFDILKLTDSEMVLCFGEPDGSGDNGAAWYWFFRAK